MTPQNWKSRRAQLIGQGPNGKEILFCFRMQFVRQKHGMKTICTCIPLVYLDHILNLQISKKNFTRELSIMGGEKWKWKISKISIRNWFSTRTFFQNSSICSELVKCGWVGIGEMWVSMGLHIGKLVFWFFFSPIVSGWWGDVFGSENFGKLWPHMGFSTKHFFQKSIEERREGKHTHPHFPNPSTVVLHCDRREERGPPVQCDHTLQNVGWNFFQHQ